MRGAPQQHRPSLVINALPYASSSSSSSAYSPQHIGYGNYSEPRPAPEHPYPHTDPSQGAEYERMHAAPVGDPYLQRPGHHNYSGPLPPATGSQHSHQQTSLQQTSLQQTSRQHTSHQHTPFVELTQGEAQEPHVPIPSLSNVTRLQPAPGFDERAARYGHLK
ncbi:hypothetical protein DFH11DRAFT_1133879 [Phellopilus nigrolimitatus]|nr:hypothetical protein DFH11DRAFT_1133879 [Phellopilus nigrolimitatus]